MGQFFRVNGDYNIKVKDGSKITLDTGSAGTVRVTGNLIIDGTSTSIDTTSLQIEDNIITLNKGEVGPGVTKGYSGIEIDRGSAEDSSVVPKASLLFYDNPVGILNDPNNVPNYPTDDLANSGYWALVTGIEPSYGYEDSNLKLRRVLTNSSTDNGDLTLIGSSSPTGLVKVTGTTDYTNEILTRTAASDPQVNDVLTNKGYVDYSILNNPTFQIRAPGIGNQGDTRVVIADANIPSGAGSTAYLLSETSYTSGDSNAESSVTFIIDGYKSAQLFKERLELPGLTIFDESYSSTGNNNLDDPVTGIVGYDAYLARQKDAIVFQTQYTNGNIRLEPNGTGRVQMTWAVQYDHANGVYPGYVNNATLIYGETESTGKTGMYFVTANNTRGEFISKNRALLFSMLF